MFREIFSLISRSIKTVLQLLVLQTSVAASWYHGRYHGSVGTDAPDDERKYRSKHVEQPRNNKLSYRAASCWSF
jgi:hypothetical protein